jgi:hypothetical protein
LPSINATKNSSYKFKMLFPIAFHTCYKIANKSSQLCTHLSLRSKKIVNKSSKFCHQLPSIHGKNIS